jgi:hypothetical protein
MKAGKVLLNYHALNESLTPRGGLESPVAGASLERAADVV